MKFKMKTVAITTLLAMGAVSGSLNAEEATPVAAVTTSAEAGTITVESTTSYEDCVTRYASQFYGSQRNDECFIHWDQFIPVNAPAHTASSPKIYIEQSVSRDNFHTRDGRFLPFATLLEKDGYSVNAFIEEGISFDIDASGNASGTLAKLTRNETLESIGSDVLVISNAATKSQGEPDAWMDPIYSAYSPSEMDAIVKWVSEGGNLLLIADHYPFPAAVAELAMRFGFKFDNGYNFDPNYNDVFVYDLLEGQLAKDIRRQLKLTSDISMEPCPVEKSGNKLEDGICYNYKKKTGEWKERTVKDDLVDEVRRIMVGLGADVNSLLFWAGDLPTAEQGFSEGDGWLTDHPITRGRTAAESIPYVTSFTGQSFTYNKPLAGDLQAYGSGEHGNFLELMRLGDETYTLMTTAQDNYFGVDADASEDNLVATTLTTGNVPDYTVPKKETKPVRHSDGSVDYYHLQGAVLTVGKGRLAVFAEAGMFTAQIAADAASQMGFNNQMATNNQQFVLNTLRWLDGTLNSATDADTAVQNSGLSAELSAIATEVQRKADAAVESRDAKTDDGVMANGEVSYARQYKDSYDGTDSFGCSTSRSATDPLLLLLVLLSAGYLARGGRRESN
ncbi:hypothetical protein D5085_17600 [Ectothiorhodospiraceae bacterium BW-2]|nr:hypothetical protein D5085_17600 [Ectothiorhodospiraceae bacterium BW-2]